ncbi:hypothetical protein [Stenotrophomonas humi]
MQPVQRPRVSAGKRRGGFRAAIRVPGDLGDFQGDARSSNTTPLHCDDHRWAARYPGAGQLTARLAGRTHTLAACGVLPSSRSQRNWAASVGHYFVMGDNRGNGDDRRGRSPDNFQPGEKLQGRAFRARRRSPGNVAALLEPTLLGTHPMINNVYLGRSQ